MNADECLIGEEVILSSNRDRIVLTSARLIADVRDWGRRERTIIFLRDISSIQLLRSGSVLFLALCFLTSFAGLMFYLFALSEVKGSIIKVALFFAILFLLIWWFSVRETIEVRSQGGATIRFLTSELSSDQKEHFLRSLQQAKLEVK